MTMVKAAVVPASKVVKVSKREKFIFMVLVIGSCVGGFGCDRRFVLFLFLVLLVI